MIEVRLFGPPVVLRDGTRVRLDTRKATALLAVLAVKGPRERAHSRDELAALLWPRTDTAHARGALRRTLSTLRAAIGPDHLDATGDHVRLVRGHTLTIDVDAFSGHLESGDDAAAVAVQQAAFLEGFTVQGAPEFEEWALRTGDDLTRDLTAALARLVTARERAGDPAGALVLAHRWLAVDPLHERAHQALIRCFAATGDRAAALRQYRTCVRTLADELGVPPLAETTELYEAVSRGSYPDPGRPAPAAPAPRPEPPSTPSTPPTLLVGRDVELDALVSAYAATHDGGRVVVVEGEPGIGKTRLVDELLRQVRARGGRTLTARAYEDETVLAFGPVLELLREAAGDPGFGAGVDATSLAEAARLLPRLAPPGTVPAPTGPASPGAEARFLAGLWDTVASTVTGTPPGVLFLDDLHWVDEATAGLVAYALHRLRGRPLLVVLAWRTPYDGPLRRVVSSLLRTGSATVVAPGRWGHDDVAALVKAVDVGLDPASADRLWQRSEGVPLVVLEYLRAGADDHAPTPVGLRDLVRSRLDPVGEEARQLLTAAAVLGRSFASETLRSVSGRTDEETVSGLEELVRAGLVEERGADLDFAHDLIRGLVYDETSVVRRRLLHLRAARVPGTPAAVVARHLHLGGRDEEAARVYAAAADQARAVFAHTETIEHLRAALALGHRDKGALLTALGDAHLSRGDYVAAARSFEAAAAQCAPDEAAVIEQRLGRLHHRLADHRLAVAHLEAAAAGARNAQPALRARIAADLSLALHAAGDTQRAEALAHEAAALAEEGGDVRARGQALNVLGMLASARGDTHTALRHLELSRELAEHEGDLELEVAVLNNLALAHRTQGDLVAAERLALAALDLCRVTGDRHHEAALHNNLADLLHDAGRPEDAMAHLKLAVRIFADLDTDDGVLQAGIWRLASW